MTRRQAVDFYGRRYNQAQIITTCAAAAASHGDDAS